MSNKYYSKEQIKKANDITVLDIAYRLGYDIAKHTGNEYEVKSQGGVYINVEKNLFSKPSEAGFGGFGAIQFVMSMENKTFKEAVQYIISEEAELTHSKFNYQKEQMVNKSYNNKVSNEKENKQLILPKKAENNKRVLAYLNKTRGIDLDIIQNVIDKDVLYQDDKGNCIFVGKDTGGEAKYAHRKPTNTYKNFIAMDVKGTDKTVPFFIGDDKNEYVVVCESCVDALSFINIKKLEGKDYTKFNTISINGVGNYKAIDTYLENYPNTKGICFAFDDDYNKKENTGQLLANKFGEKYKKLNYKVYNSKPILNDFNEDMKLYAKGYSKSDIESVRIEKEFHLLNQHNNNEMAIDNEMEMSM